MVLLCSLRSRVSEMFWQKKASVHRGLSPPGDRCGTDVPAATREQVTSRGVGLVDSSAGTYLWKWAGQGGTGMGGRSRAENGLEGRWVWQCRVGGSTRLSRLLRVDGVNCRFQPEEYLRLPACGGVGARRAWVAGVAMGLGACRVGVL